MFRNIFEHVQGIEYIPILTMIFFFSFFVAVLILVLRMDKQYAAYMGELPLNGEEEFNKNKYGESNV